MIGYLLDQEFRERPPDGRSVATLLTQVIVDGDDPRLRAADQVRSGPVYDRATD